MAEQRLSSPLQPRTQWFDLKSPIGVIGAFAALVEVALILSSIWADGGFRWGVLIAALIIFSGTAGPVFLVLWHRPEVLYPPREYGATSVEEFADQMRRRSSVLSGEKMIEEVDLKFRDALLTAQTEIVQALSSTDSGDSAGAAMQVEKVVVRSLNTAASIAVEEIKESLLITFFWPSHKTGRLMAASIPFDGSMLAHDFLLQSILAFEGHIDTSRSSVREALMTYGVMWAWQERGSGQLFNRMGTPWAHGHAQGTDVLPIFELGLRAGMELERVPLAGSPPMPRAETDGILTR